MRRYLLATGVLSMLILPAGLLAQEKNVIVAEGDKLPTVKVGDVIRISGSGAAGRTEISASVKGPAKLVSTANVRKFKDGKPLIGAVTKEFEIRAQKRGKAVIKVNIKDVVENKTETKEYELEIK